ncbi:hypothetical protein ACUN0C_10435 [Faunimonas sp. B44]|uniref:hypothetical protein n=1 Tax=Faunimonas sp. B44 TaxID=3461493 RepID=UPI004043CE19
MSKIILALGVAGILCTQAASAADLRPAAGASVRLGDVSGVAFYTVEPEGYRVVVTLAASGSQPMRFVATLSSGQSVTLSVPGPVGAAAAELTIARIGDSVEIGDRMIGKLADARQ